MNGVLKEACWKKSPDTRDGSWGEGCSFLPVAPLSNFLKGLLLVCDEVFLEAPQGTNRQPSVAPGCKEHLGEGRTAQTAPTLCFRHGKRWERKMNSKFFELKKEKQDRMINAALKVFAVNGYRHASTDDVVKEANISKGLLFHYFENKLGVYQFAYDYAVRYMSTKRRLRSQRR